MLGVSLADSSYERGVLEVDERLITRLRSVDERVRHVELGNAVDWMDKTHRRFTCINSHLVLYTP